MLLGGADQVDLLDEEKDLRGLTRPALVFLSVFFLHPPISDSPDILLIK
jgi:hypothetical protein